MSNIYDYGVNGLFPSKVGGTGVAVKYFPRLVGISGTTIGSAGLGGVSGSSVSAPLFGTSPSTPSATSAVGALYLPAQSTNNGQLLNIIVVGSFGNDTGDPSGTVNVKLYGVTGKLLAPVYTALASTGAVTPSALGIVNSWALSVELYGDSGSGILGGSYAAYQNGALVNSTVKSTDTTISGLDFLNGNAALQQGAVLGFVVGVTFGTSDASNTASMFEFAIES
jgi:hypothetical protein